VATRSALYDLFQRFIELRDAHGSVGGEALDILRHWAWENSGTAVYVTHVLETKRDRARQLFAAGYDLDTVVRYAGIDRSDAKRIMPKTKTENTT